MMLFPEISLKAIFGVVVFMILTILKAIIAGGVACCYFVEIGL